MIELWNIEDIKELDFPSPTGFMKVKDFLPQVIEEVKEEASTQYSLLKNSMKTQGQLVPLRISRNKTRLMDGIHRIALATILEWKFMDVSTERRESDWDTTEEGIRYWQLWLWRLRGFRGKAIG
jgi:hypothetical protein